MIIDRFANWSSRAPTARRVEAADALARAYLHSPLSGDERTKALRNLFMLVDDPAVPVRQRLADVYADRRDAPRAIVLRLLDDVPSVCAPLYARSPHLLTRHLLDGLQRADSAIASAVAARISLDGSVIEALIDHGGTQACRVLAANTAIALNGAQIARFLDRFAGDQHSLDVLQGHRKLSVPQHCELVLAHAKALQANSFVQALVPQGRIARLAGLAGDRAVLELVGGLESATIWQEMQGLCSRGVVTSAFVLRAALCGRMAVVEAIVGQLAGTPAQRVRSAFVHPRPAVAAALLKKTMLGASVREVLAMSLVLARELARADIAWSDDFFAQALGEVIEQRVAMDEQHGHQGPGFEDAVAALCLDIVADIMHGQARREERRAPDWLGVPEGFAFDGDVEDGVLGEDLMNAVVLDRALVKAA
jgi:uncharacterized protein (DUF2336 family)